MTGATNSNLSALEHDVLRALHDLCMMEIPDWISDHRGAPELYAETQLYGFFDFGIPPARFLQWFSEDWQETPGRMEDLIVRGGLVKEDYGPTAKIRVEIEENARAAQAFLTRRELVLTKLCPALSRTTNDPSDLNEEIAPIAKEITPVIQRLALSGVVAIPSNPLFIALVAMMVHKMGVANLCGEIARA